jgi:hypothetical protein
MRCRISAIYGTGSLPAENGKPERHVLLPRHLETEFVDADGLRDAREIPGKNADAPRVRRLQTPPDCAP